MRIFSLSAALKFIALVSIVTLVGCESADVDPDHIAASGSSDGASDGGGSAGQTEQRIAVSPPTALHTTKGNFTVLEVDPLSGYTFTWTLSNSTLGSLSPSTGNKTTYYTSSIPPTGSTVQTITVTGKSPNSSVVYQGTSRITHSAP